MKNLIFIWMFCIAVSTTSNAQTTLDGIAIKPNDSGITVNFADSYKANTTGSDYKGRNEKTAKGVAQSTVSNSSSRSRTETFSKAGSVDVDTLESTAGEFVQKLEDDRVKRSKTNANLHNQNQTELTRVFNDAYRIKEQNLGQEQDPYIENAFSCANKSNCDYDNPNDSHAAKKCTDSQVLHWTGAKWECVGVFDNPVPATCTGATKYTKPVNGGNACLNYIYKWEITGYGSCTKDGVQEAIYTCKQEEQDGKNKKTSPNQDYCLANKPTSKKACVYYGDWKLGSWGSCNKSCGGGLQYRTVDCSAIECKGVKPPNVQSCNTQVCTTSWSVGNWGGCNKTCGGGTQYRNVVCPAGYVCPAAKPTTSQSCNTQACYSCPSGYTLNGTTCESGHHCRGDTNNNILQPPNGASARKTFIWNGQIIGYAEKTLNGYTMGSLVRSLSNTYYGVYAYQICGKDRIAATRG